jgi:hypothetical protein
MTKEGAQEVLDFMKLCGNEVRATVQQLEGWLTEQAGGAKYVPNAGVARRMEEAKPKSRGRRRSGPDSPDASPPA